MKKVTLLIPVYNEEAMLPTLYQRLIELINRNSTYAWEILFINDGSSDRTLDVIRQLRQTDSRVNFVNLSRNFGKEIAMLAGFDYTTGDCCVVMDADLQDSPDEIPELYRMITEEGYDLVSGWKKKRYDPLSKTIPTKLFNATARKFSGITNLHDFNCGLKAYKNIVIKNIEVYNDMHRYIP